MQVSAGAQGGGADGYVDIVMIVMAAAAADTICGCEQLAARKCAGLRRGAARLVTKETDTSGKP